MGILRLVPDPLPKFRFGVENRDSERSIIPAAPGTEAASNPPPVVLRNCLRSRVASLRGFFIRFTSVSARMRRNSAIRAALYADARKPQSTKSRRKTYVVGAGMSGPGHRPVRLLHEFRAGSFWRAYPFWGDSSSSAGIEAGIVNARSGGCFPC